MNTIADYLKWTEAQFNKANLYFGHGTDNAWDEAVQLVLHVMQLPVNSGEEVLQLNVNQVQAAKIKECVNTRIKEHMPLPYITNQAWFAGRPFYVDERVLIPRSPFGEWIQRKFQPWIKPQQVKRILEIGTGSGCMAIAAALQFPNAEVDAVDVSNDALAVANINIKRYKLTEQVHLLKSDCFDSVGNYRYDIIMANPPYISQQEILTLPEEYRHEPIGALQADDEGLAIVIKILRAAHQFLTPHGILIVEVGNSDEALIKRFPQMPFVWLEQEFGGHGLLLLTADQLNVHHVI